jgi:hypothetical protein
LLHPIFAARRDPSGRLELLAAPEGGPPRESFTHVAVPRTTDPAVLKRLEEAVRAALADVQLVTDDFAAAIARAQAIAAESAWPRRRRPAGTTRPRSRFLRWLVDGGFGSSARAIPAAEVGDASLLQLRPAAGSGSFAARSARLPGGTPTRRAARLGARWLVGGRLLTVAKTLAEAPVHRRAAMEDVVVKQLDAEGRVTGRGARPLHLEGACEEAGRSRSSGVLCRSSPPSTSSGSHDHRRSSPRSTRCEGGAVRGRGGGAARPDPDDPRRHAATTSSSRSTAGPRASASRSSSSRRASKRRATRSATPSRAA